MTAVLGNYLIGLREGLEASLVVVILIAYLVKTDRRHLLPRIWAGIARRRRRLARLRRAAHLGPRELTFEAQEAIGGILSIIAVGFVTWMVFWMARHARGLSGELRGKVDAAAEAGRASLVVVAAPRRRPRGPGDRAVPLGGDPGGHRRDGSRPRRCSAPCSASSPRSRWASPSTRAC